MAAHRLRRDEKLLELQAAEGPVEGYRVRSMRGGAEADRVVHDEVPAGYTMRSAQEHGELRLAPAVDALLARARAQRGRLRRTRRGP